MAVQIKYDGEDPFDGLPTPFVERSVEYIGDNSTVDAVEQISLRGQIPPSGATNCDRFTYFINEQTSLLNYFSNSYKKFEIIEDGEVIVSRENVRINSVDFSDSNYSSMLEYAITLSVYRGDFMVHSGVADVSNTISYKENEDKTLSISHEVSARGIRDSESASSSTALEKAKAFVGAEIARQKIDIPPVLISHAKVSDSESPMTPTVTETAFLETVDPILISLNENIDRLSGSYSVSKEYKSDLYFYEEGLLRYTADLDLSPDGYNIVRISGDITYEEDLSGQVEFDKLVSRYKSFDFFGAAKRLSGIDSLNKVPLNRSVSKDSSKNILSFSLSYDNNPNFSSENGVETVMDFSFSNDSNFITINVGGSMSARLGIKNRWEVAKNAFDILDIAAQAKTAYESHLEDVLGYDNSLMEKMPFNNNILEKSISFNKSEGIVDFSYSFDNFSQTPDNTVFKMFDYNVSVSHPTSQFAANKEYLGSWVVQDSGSSPRGSKNVSGSAVKKAGVTCQKATEEIIKFMSEKEQNGLTETKRDISFDGISSFSFDFAWSTQDSVKMLGESTDGVAEITLTSTDLITMS